LELRECCREPLDIVGLAGRADVRIEGWKGRALQNGGQAANEDVAHTMALQTRKDLVGLEGGHPSRESEDRQGGCSGRNGRRQRWLPGAGLVSSRGAQRSGRDRGLLRRPALAALWRECRSRVWLGQAWSTPLHPSEVYPRS